jgi:hypothetical protein
MLELATRCQRPVGTVVSTRTLSLMRGGPIECEALRQGPSHPSHPFNRFFSAANTTYL